MSAPLLLLHGVGCSPRFWDGVARLVPRPVSAPPLPDVDGVAAMAAALAPDVPDGAVVVGHSLGGMVAQELALLPASPVGALVLACTIPGSSDSVRAHNLPAAELAERSGSAALADLMVPVLVGPDAGLPGREHALGCVRQDMTATPPAVLARDLRAITAFDARSRLPGLHLPALVVAGEGEPNLPDQQWLAAALRARFVVLAGAGHLAPAEDERAFATLVTEFVTSLEGAS